MDQKINIHIYSYDDGTVSVDVSVPPKIDVKRLSRKPVSVFYSREKTNANHAKHEEGEGLLYDELF